MSEGEHRRSKSRPAISTVDRAARVLSAFQSSWDFLTLNELAQRAGLSKPTVFRILASLGAEGLVFQDESNSTYGLGFLTLRIADVFRSTSPSLERFAEPMRTIRDQLNENVGLALRDGDRTFDIEVLEGGNMITPAQIAGVAVPLHSSVQGKALLAAMEPQEAGLYLSGLTRAGAPFAQVGRLRRELKAITTAGYASGCCDAMLGGHTIAMAMSPSPGGESVALHVSFPQARFTEDLKARCVAALENVRGGLAQVRAVNNSDSIG